MSYTADGPAGVGHELTIDGIGDELGEIAQFFQDHPGSLPDQEEDIEAMARSALSRLENFVTERWGS